VKDCEKVRKQAKTLRQGKNPYAFIAYRAVFVRQRPLRAAMLCARRAAVEY
jgi:hypothetical protein